MTKEQFLNNLEKALQRLVLNHLFDDANEEQKAGLRSDVAEFIRENAGSYTFEELKETFVSGQTAVGLFLEYQDAKEICRGGVKRPADLETGLAGLLNCGQCGTSAPVFPSDEWQEPVTGMDFVWVSGGSFQMGSGSWDDQGLGDEKPVHEVWLDGLWVGKYPVLVSQYLAFVMDAGERQPAWLEEGGKYNIYTGADDLYKALGAAVASDGYPIVGVSWDDAVAYAQWMSEKTSFYFRLPTEAEWEYSARSGGREEKYAGGQDMDARAWYCDNSNGCAHPVGTKSPNGLGIHDMCGNVSEWCLDFYHKEAYQNHKVYNPQNKEEGPCRAVRGGSWNYGARDVRCADRGLFTPEYCGYDLGFRLVRQV
ncbi:MAG: formylglycine-generating enzyme family protein [Deltaproteobacteria bacterium]|nr:formylglycine-generating enzyme family protein [Deltaproteobacteria bacterium]